MKIKTESTEWNWSGFKGWFVVILVFLTVLSFFVWAVTGFIGIFVGC